MGAARATASEELADDRLHLILLCCHPALPRESRSALALRLVIGTPTEQIARLFLVPPATMAARLTRAKKKIVLAGIPLGAPLEDELRARLDEVCRTIYLAFTAGYTPGAGPDLLRADLAGDAVRLAVVLHDLVPDAPQVRAMLALRGAPALAPRRPPTRRPPGDPRRPGPLDVAPRRGAGRARARRRARSPPRDTPRSSGSKPSSPPSTPGRPPPRRRTGPRSPATTPTLEARTGSAIVRLNRPSRSPRPRSPGRPRPPRRARRRPAGQPPTRRRPRRARAAGRRPRARPGLLPQAIDLCANEVERAHLTPGSTRSRLRPSSPSGGPSCSPAALSRRPCRAALPAPALSVSVNSSREPTAGCRFTEQFTGVWGGAAG